MSPPAQSRRWPLAIVANRLPVRRVGEGARARWEISPGGLVSALRPIMERSAGAWVGWSGQIGRGPEPFVHEEIANIPVPLSGPELAGFYHGFSNRTIWPLYHDAVRQPEYHRHWWARYRTVNERFAERAAEVVERGGVVWVHDYQLQLVPGLLRELRPDLRIGFFLHIPFPPQELFARLPWRRQILEGLLGANVIGFQTRVGAANFRRVARRFTDAQGRGNSLMVEGREVRVDRFAISIDFDRYDAMARDPAVLDRCAALKQQLGRSRRVILGVDRLDYTKGIDMRLKGYWEFLARGRHSMEHCVLVQVAVPSREEVEEYIELRSQVEELVGQINGEFGEVGTTAVHYLRRNLPFEELVALYRAADVMLVTPLRDGMNLVAKEYVATRFDDTGVLVLSEFTGSAYELGGALQVNPHDVDGLADALETALEMPEGEVTRRMRRLRKAVRNHTVYDWADSFMSALAGR